MSNKTKLIIAAVLIAISSALLLFTNINENNQNNNSAEKIDSCANLTYEECKKNEKCQIIMKSKSDPNSGFGPDGLIYQGCKSK